MPLRRPWTEIDMQEALLLRVRGTKLRELVNDRRNRGLERLPERTIRRRLQAVLEAVDNHIGANDSVHSISQLSDKTLRSLIKDAAPKSRGGIPPLLTDLELMLLARIWTGLADMGLPMTSAGARDMAISFLQQKYPDRSSSLMSLHRTYIGRCIKRVNRIFKDHDCEHLQLTTARGSKIDLKRARKATPAVRNAFFDKYESFVNDLRGAGSIPEDDKMAAKHFQYGDEIGFDPRGKFRKFLFKLRGKEKRQERTTGEKAPFWSTCLFFTSADGSLRVPPCIVHQAAATGGNSSLMLGLRSDFWFFTNEAGYMTKQGFIGVVKRIANSTSTRPLILIIDGHDSHMIPDAYMEMVCDRVYFVYIPSHTSGWLAPNDNGPNSILKGLVGSHITRWRRQHPTMHYSQPDFNSCITKAWNDFEKTDPEKICSAWRKTGLFPVNRHATDDKVKNISTLERACSVVDAIETNDVMQSRFHSKCFLCHGGGNVVNSVAQSYGRRR
eukprot:jgi/Bigna1/132464/aug1.17_g7172